MESRKKRYRRPFLSIFLIGAIVIISGFSFIFFYEGKNKPADQVQDAEELIPTGKQSYVLSDIFTSERKFALTFNGLGDRNLIMDLLDELDQYEMKATFFLPGMRVAEEPDLAEEILRRGHEVESNTLNGRDMYEMSYTEIMKDLQITNEIFERELGFTPKYVRTRSGDVTDDLRAAAADLGMEAVITYSINPRDRDMQSAAELGQYVERFMRRGSVILLHTNINPEVVGSIRYIAEAAVRKGFTAARLIESIENGGVRKPFEAISGYDLAQANLDFEQTDYVFFTNIPTGENKVVLTFDDWGSDATIESILQTLADHDVLATFFLVGQGVESNPNLARMILDEGHEIANHSYSHKVVTTITAEELQEEVIKAHHVITEAIQQPPLMIFRPPTGAIDERAARIIAATGYTTIANFDVTTYDWDETKTAEDITEIVMDKSTDGSIILLHILDGISTPEALPQIIVGLKERGYTFVKLTELMEYYDGREEERVHESS